MVESSSNTEQQEVSKGRAFADRIRSFFTGKTSESRRKFLKLTAAGLGAAATAAAVGPERIINAVGGLPPFGRELLTGENNSHFINQEASNEIFAALEPQRFDSKVLNPEVFFDIVQFMAKLSVNYFSGNPQSNPEAFKQHVQKFIGDIDSTAKMLGIGLPQVLMGFGTSAVNIGGRAHYNEDVITEAKIAMVNKVDELLSQDSAEGEKEKLLLEIWKLAIKYAKNNSMGTFDIPRVLGPRTYGIHDMESIQIARALLHGSEISNEFRENVEKFVSQDVLQKLVTDYEQLDTLKERLDTYLNDSKNTQLVDLCNLLKDPQLIRSFITDPENPNHLYPWQLTRTTLTWSNITYLETVKEDDALSLNNTATIDLTVSNFTETEDGPQTFIRTQITNPLFRNFLRNKIQESPGVAIYHDLLNFSDQIIAQSDQCMHDNQQADEEFINVELNQDFQVLSGTAFIKFLYDQNVPKDRRSFFENSTTLDELVYSQLAFGTGREIGSQEMLADRTGITVADLPYLSPEVQQLSLEKLRQEYNEKVGKAPEDDQEAFLKYLQEIASSSRIIVKSSNQPKAHVIELNKEAKDFITGPGMRSARQNLEEIYKVGLRKPPGD